MQNTSMIQIKYCHKRNTYIKIHTHSQMYVLHTDMYLSVSFTTFSNINKFVFCMYVPKDAYKYRHAGFLMERWGWKKGREEGEGGV
jgi:hypothetical protein